MLAQGRGAQAHFTHDLERARVDDRTSVMSCSLPCKNAYSRHTSTSCGNWGDRLRDRPPLMAGIDHLTHSLYVNIVPSYYTHQQWEREKTLSSIQQAV